MSDDIPESYIEVELNQQPIELYKLLKIANLVSGGGEAKVVISEGYVLLNGEVEFQKRKKIYHEDVIEFNGETLQLVINENPTDADELIDQTLTGPELPLHDELLNKGAHQGTEPSAKPSKKQKSQAKAQNKAKERSVKKAANNAEHLEIDPSLPRKRRPISF